MGTYAKDTQVTPERSRQEIEQTLKRYGATAFAYMTGEQQSTVVFEAHGRRVRFDVKHETVTRDRHGYRLGVTKGRQATDKLLRQRWRALALVVKAKLEAVDAGIVTFEQEFLAHIMLPDGTTVGEWAAPQLERTYETGQMPPLLLGAGS